MNHYLISTLLFIGFGISLFAQNQDLRQEATVPPTIYEVRQQCLRNISQRYREMYDGEEQPYYLKKVEIYTPTDTYYVEKQIFVQSLDPEYEQIREWFDFLEPRLYPSGHFVDAAGIMMREIKSIKKNSLNKEKEQGQCSVVAQWQNIGPFAYKTDNPNNQTNATISQTTHGSRIPGVGRVNFIKKHPNNDTLYIGASNGGLWTSGDNGTTWRVLNDKIAVLGTSDLVFDPNNDSTMYLATGDKSRSQYLDIGRTTYSVGVLRSTNWGKTWNELAPVVKWQGLKDGLNQSLYMKINNLLFTQSGDLLISTTGSPLTIGNGTSEGGVWKWDDNSDTWQHIYITGNDKSVTDMIQLPSGEIVICENEGRLLILANGSSFFTMLTVNIPLGNVQRVNLAAYPSGANTNTFYVAYVNNNGNLELLLKSTDGGQNFSPILPASGTFNQLFDSGVSHLGITVDPTDENIVYLSGNKEIYKLTIALNGSVLVATPVKTSKWDRSGTLNDEDYVHPDVKGFTWTNNNTLYVATDGGIARTTDGGANWTKWYELTRDLAISECYRMGVVPNNPDVIFTGTHDNGIWRLDKNSTNSQWLNIKGGDCGEIAPVSEYEIYTHYFADKEIRKMRKTSPDFYAWDENINVSPFWEDGNINHQGTQQSLFYSNSDLFATHTNLYKRTALSTDWTDLTGGIANLSHNALISAMAIAPSNTSTMYIAKRRSDHSEPDSSKSPLIYRSDNAGSNWLPVYDYITNTQTDTLPWLHLNRIAVHPTDPQRLWAVFSGYQATQKVYESTNGGVAWKNITGGGLPNLPVNAIAAYEKDGLVQLVVGTDIGVYYTNETLIACSGGVQWKYFGQGATPTQEFPNVIVQELEVHGTGANRVLRAATFGRGVWETPLPTLNNCQCAVCGEEGYPLQANFVALPQSAVQDPLFEPITNWTQWLTTLSAIQFQDASIGVIPSDGYEWSFSPNWPTLLSDCDGNDLIDQNCALAVWEEEGDYSVTLTVTDETGCTSSIEQSITLFPYDPDCIVSAPLEVNTMHPIQTCDLSLSNCPVQDENGSLSITPISTEIGSGSYYYEISKQGTPGVFAANEDLILEPNGQLKLDCLAPGTYTVLSIDNINNCTAISTQTLNNPTTMGQLAINKWERRGSSDCNGDISITEINNSPFDPTQYTFVWADCATCGTPVRTGLCSGFYTVTVTNELTGCQGTQTISIPSLCPSVGDDGSIGVIGTIEVYPTLFNDVANLRIDLNYDAEVSVDVYNLYGVFIKKLMNQEIKEAGEYYLQDDASAVTDGVYIYIMRACTETKGDIGIKY